MHDREEVTTQSAHLWHDDRGDERRRNRRIDRVTAVFQCRHARLRNQGVGGGNHSTVGEDRRQATALPSWCNPL
jgi:hypothetical protein